MADNIAPTLAYGASMSSVASVSSADDQAAADAQKLIEEAVCKEPLQRELKYRILAYCCERRELSEIEAHVAAMPQFEHAAQNQYHMIVVLERAGGLRRIEFDADGAEITSERVEGLSADEADDLVATTYFEITEEGAAFVDACTPAMRFSRLLADEPDRAEAFFSVLHFCSEKPRSYGELTKLLSENEALLAAADGSGQRIQPSVFLDRLERSGLIEWDDGWKTSEEGVECQAFQRK